MRLPWAPDHQQKLDRSPSAAAEYEVFLSPEERMKRAADRHEREMRDKDLGRLGRWLGGERHAPLNLAAMFLGISLVIGVGCLIAALNHHDDAEFWGRAAERSFGAAAAALAYVFGQGSKA